MKIIIYQSNIIEIGGIETFTYNLTKALSNYYDVLLLYKNCHPKQLYRLMQEVECEKYDSRKEYECDICILASSWGGYPDTVNAKEYIQMIHANYKEANKTFKYVYKPFSKTTKHIAVSTIARDVFKEMYGYECDLMYNLLDDIKETKPILKLVSATRLSAEKGYNRMLKLIEELEKRNIKFRWIIFTNKDTYKPTPLPRLAPNFIACFAAPAPCLPERLEPKTKTSFSFRSITFLVIFTSVISSTLYILKLEKAFYKHSLKSF